MQRFDCSITDGIYNIQWINLPIPHYVYAYVKELMSNSNDYTVINSINKQRLMGELEEINKYYETNII